jgi:hypothetical protein
MKKLYTSFTIIINHCTLGQDNNQTIISNKEFKLAQNLLENRLSSRDHSFIDKQNQKLPNCQKKADSIKTILRKDKINSLIGNGNGFLKTQIRSR